MLKSKLVAIFYALTAYEKIAFRKWVASPFFNKQESVSKLLEYIYPLDLETDRALLDRGLVYQAVFGTTTLDMPKLRYVASELTQLLEQFLVYQHSKSQDIHFQLDLSMVYKQKGLTTLSQQSVERAAELHQSQPLKDIKQLENTYQIEWALYNMTSEKDRSIANNLQTLNNSFDHAYIAGKLKHSCRILSHQGMYAQQYDTGLLSQVLDYLAQHPASLLEPAIGLYYYYYMASVDARQDEFYFKQFKQYLFDYQHFFDKNEVRDLYILATNYSIKRLNTDQHEYYLQETFELYQQALEQNILLDNGKISPFAFSNIVAISLSLKKYDWSWAFIQEYKNHLSAGIQRAYTDYNLSKWYFHRQQYQKAEELLVAEDFEDLHLNLSAKMLLLKIYYELQEFQLLDALLNRFKTFLSRQKELVYHKNNYNNIIRFTKRLVGINPYSEKAKLKLKKEIQGVELLTEKAWLLEQLEK